MRGIIKQNRSSLNERRQKRTLTPNPICRVDLSKRSRFIDLPRRVVREQNRGMKRVVVRGRKGIKIVVERYCS